MVITNQDFKDNLIAVIITSPRQRTPTDLIVEEAVVRIVAIITYKSQGRVADKI